MKHTKHVVALRNKNKGTDDLIGFFCGDGVEDSDVARDQNGAIIYPNEGSARKAADQANSTRADNGEGGREFTPEQPQLEDLLRMLGQPATA